MALAVRSLLLLLKALLFIGIYALVVRLVHTYPMPMPPEQQHILFALSRWLGVRDPDDLYLSTLAIADLIVAFLVYWLIMKVCRRFLP
jgi:hypothetical protein